jgi:AhpD family alkylhydroperoxidase
LKKDWINNFWKVIANHPATLRRIWDSIKEVMIRPSAIDPLSKEFIYIAVSITNNCRYCLASHSAAAREKGMTDEQFAELLSIVALANETNRLAIGYDVEVDEASKKK